MSRVKGKDTRPERLIRSELHRRGLRFRKHVKDLPGKPDIVFSKAKVAVFIDGDFWHGYRFSTWENKLSDSWKQKIQRNRERDQKNFRKLRNKGWRVVRIWEHEVDKNKEDCIRRITQTL